MEFTEILCTQSTSREAIKMQAINLSVILLLNKSILFSSSHLIQIPVSLKGALCIYILTKKT
jgi:hypothetical protein